STQRRRTTTGDEKAAKLDFIDCSKAFHNFPTDKTVADANAWLAGIAAKYDLVSYVDFNKTMCPSGCSLFVGSEPVYFNRHHLNVAAGKLLGRQIAESGEKLPL
ncbi:SGNH hydrolase domain-containing protein, partial [Rhizobiaceae sp. 2RAB30]